VQTLIALVQIAAKLSSGLGREILHVKLTEDQQFQRFLKLGMPEHYAKLLTSLEVGTAGGSEVRTSDAVEKVTGRTPLDLDHWVQQNKTAWE
jgi:hypothetical protein